MFEGDPVLFMTCSGVTVTVPVVCPVERNCTAESVLVGD